MNTKGILIGLFGLFLGFFSIAIEIDFKVRVGHLGVLISFILGIIGLIVHVRGVKPSKR
jgi:hypothetical protein